MTAQVGQPAPNFTLKDQHGNDVSLADFKGRQAVALVFYPFTFSGVCQGELCQLRDDFGDFESAGVQVVAVSCDSRHAQRTWAEQHGFGFPVLSDFWPHGEVARRYGVFDETVGCALRATFLVDRDGVIVDEFRSDAIGTAREFARYREALAKL